MDKNLAAGFSITGRLATVVSFVSLARPHVEKFVEVELSKDYDVGLKQLENAVRVSLRGNSLLGIGGGAGGDVQKGRIYRAPNLHGWEDRPLSEDLAKAFGVPVVLRNDAETAAAAEVAFSIRTAASVQILWTEGVGGGHIALDGAFTQLEPGHRILYPDGRLCHCGHRGCLEAYVGGWAIEERFKKPLRELMAKEWTEVLGDFATGLAELYEDRRFVRAVFCGKIVDDHSYHLAELERLLNERLEGIRGEDPPVLLTPSRYRGYAIAAGGLPLLLPVLAEQERVRKATLINAHRERLKREARKTKAAR